MKETTIKPGWKTVKFGDVVSLNRDRVADPVADGIERYVGLEHITPEDLRICSWGLVAEGTTFTNYFQPGQVLFGKRRAYQRKVAVADFDGVCSGDIYVLEPTDPAVLLPELLPFICQTEGFYEHAVGTSAGSLSPRTNWTQLAKYEFPLPPLDEQRRIVDLLSSSLEMIEASSDLSEASENLLWAFAKQTFDVHKDIYPLLTVPELTQRLTVGIVVKPADWYVSDGEGVPALRSLNVQPGKLQLNDLVHISQEGHDVHKKSQLTGGDIVVVRSGRPGDATVIPENFGPLNCIDLVISTPTDAILPDYFVAFLNSPPGRREFAAGMAGTAQKHFNVSAFRKLKVPCPPMNIQKDFVEKFTSLQSSLSKSEMRQNKNNQLHLSILNELLGA